MTGPSIVFRDSAVSREWKTAAAVGVAFLVGILLSFLLSRVSAVGGADDDARQDAGIWKYSRIVCMSPAAVEMVFAVGAGERVVGIPEFTQHPPEALDLPVCGGYHNPNYERIMTLAPDLILTQGEAERMTRFGRQTAIEVLALPLTGLESIQAAILRVGRVVEREARAQQVVAGLRERLDRIREVSAGRPRVPVVIVTWREPGALADIGVVGPGGFLHDLVEVAGGRNVFRDLSSEYSVVSKEALLTRAPEVVVELHGEGEDSRLAESEVLRVWQGLPTLPAVRNGRVYAVEASYAMVPGPRVVQLAERLFEVFHREGSDAAAAAAGD